MYEHFDAILDRDPLLRYTKTSARCAVRNSEISVTETITETEISDPTLTETETMVFVETEVI